MFCVDKLSSLVISLSFYIITKECPQRIATKDSEIKSDKKIRIHIMLMEVVEMIDAGVSEKYLFIQFNVLFDLYCIENSIENILFFFMKINTFWLAYPHIYNVGNRLFSCLFRWVQLEL